MSVSIWAQVFHFWSIDVCPQKPVACIELITVQLVVFIAYPLVLFIQEKWEQI